MTPDFVIDLRNKVGSAHLLWIPGVHAIVIERGQVLLHRRSDTSEWSLLGGILEPGEEPADGVVREVWEEAGVRVIPESLISVTVSPKMTHHNGDRAQYLELAFRCRMDGESQSARVNDDESLEVGWFDLERLPDMREGMHERIALASSGCSVAWFTPGMAPGLKPPAVLREA